MRDDLEQVKSDIRIMSDKLETLKSFETGDKGQFISSLWAYTGHFVLHLASWAGNCCLRHPFSPVLEPRQGGDILTFWTGFKPGHYPRSMSALQYRHEAPPRHGAMCQGPSSLMRSVGPIPIRALPVHSLPNLAHQ